MVKTGFGAVFLTRNFEIIIKNNTLESDNYQASGWQIINIQVPAASTFTYKGEITGNRFRLTDHREGGAQGLVILIEFESLEAARAFYESDAYSEARAARERISDTDLILVEGL